jgi:hypothetical protein
MNGFETTVERWYDYYVAAGGAAAVLVGLLFVSLSLHLDREASEHGSATLTEKRAEHRL